MAGCRSCNEKGSSLIELLIAVSVFAVGLLAVAGMQLAAMRGNRSANVLTAASGLAEGVLEEMLAWRSDHPLLAVDRADQEWLFDAASITKTVDGAGTFRARYAIDADYGEPRLTRIEVGVAPVGGGPSGAVTLVGFKRRG